MTIRGISVGVDGSEISRGALAWAVGLARHSNASLRAAQVWQLPFVCTYPWSTPSVEESERHATEVVQQALQQAGIADTAEQLVLRGKPGPTLSAECSDADLLVVGCTGQECARRKPDVVDLSLGSTARYVLHHATSPVAAVPDGATWTEGSTVLVGIDGSPASYTALRWAVSELPHDCVIHAVQAIEYPSIAAEIPNDYELLDPIVEDHRQELQKQVDEALGASPSGSGRRVKAHVSLGHARDALLHPGFDADLVVVADHADDSPRALLGSVSEHTLRHSKVPVIVVPSQGETR